MVNPAVPFLLNAPRTKTADTPSKYRRFGGLSLREDANLLLLTRFYAGVEIDKTCLKSFSSIKRRRWTTLVVSKW